jgi:hypothetical protein
VSVAAVKILALPPKMLNYWVKHSNLTAVIPEISGHRELDLKSSYFHRRHCIISGCSKL